MKNTYILALILSLAMMVGVSGCSSSVPGDATPLQKKPLITPDYTDVTVPSNIAPLNFSILSEADDYVTHIHVGDDDGIVVDGAEVTLDAGDWKDLIEQAQGSAITVDVYTKTDGEWSVYEPFTINIAEEIDPWISYRLIEPSYINYETMRINQRCLENFDEKEIFNNCVFADEEKGNCINCHSYQNYNADGAMQMHVRGPGGGTLIVRDGEVAKVNLKRPGTISPGVYPAWHPTLPIIAYSNNETIQNFHQTDPNKIEVSDRASSLVLYDIDADRITPITSDSMELATFPAWGPDGKTLYYALAQVPDSVVNGSMNVTLNNYKNIHYNILRRTFDQSTRTFSEPDTVYNAAAIGKSAVLPRISPDGRYLLFSMAEYGTFHIWHHDADLYVMDLTTGETRALDAANSPDTESYHSWSSNGRWILFSSRRDDGNYTRLYIAYFDPQGRVHKPFRLPQRSRAADDDLYKSYNVPEFMVAPVTVSRSQLIDALSEED